MSVGYVQRLMSLFQQNKMKVTFKEWPASSLETIYIGRIVLVDLVCISQDSLYWPGLEKYACFMPRFMYCIAVS